MVKQELPLSPEQLMRSRYSAYVEKNFDYLKKTMQDPALSKFTNTNGDSKVSSNENLEWLGLTVTKSYYDPSDKDIGYVEFIAKYKLNGVEHAMHELSKFHHKEGNWYYVDAETLNTKKL